MLSTSGYFVVRWTDEYLVWDVDQFNGTQEILLPQDEIWKPDLLLANSYKSFTGMGYPNLKVKVNSTGYVQWFPSQVLESTCSVNIRYFPFDKQTCVIKINAWSYSEDDIEFSIANDNIDLDDFTTNSQWDVLSTNARVLNTNDEPAVEFELHLKRRASFYVLNIIIPVLLLSLLSAFSFVLPADSGERAGYAVTIFLSLAVFLTIISSELPKNSKEVSYLSVYLLIMIVCNTVMLAIGLAQVRLVSRDEAMEPVGHNLRCLYRLYRKLKCSSAVAPKESLNVVDVIDKETEKRAQQECPSWPEVVSALDFLMFWLFIIITVLCTVVLYLICLL
ncbi:neuronal acetylcholine receptor subunit beta-3-like [Dreissena polymorpha]|nr:neuronal acetylcholine receptor subunit beta-3-like [Dreissena polymorpha]